MKKLTEEFNKNGENEEKLKFLKDICFSLPSGPTWKKWICEKEKELKDNYSTKDLKLIGKFWSKEGLNNN